MQYAGSRLDPEVKVWPFEDEAAIGRGERGDGVAKGWVLVQDPDGSQRSFWEAMASEASHGEGQPIDESAQVGDTLLRTPSQLWPSRGVVVVLAAPRAGC